MKKQLLQLCIVTILISSCTATSNLYVSDPDPVGKSNFKMNAGIGSGLAPKIDSTSANGNINYSNGLTLAPNLCFAMQYGLGDKTNFNFGLHFPYFIAGIGLHTGIQYSFFRKESLFNAALGADLGFVFAKDELVIGNAQIELNPETKGAFNADLFLPIAYRFNENCKIIITPRMSFYSFSIRKSTDPSNSKTQKYKPTFPSISLGVRIKSIHIEGTMQFLEKKIMPGFGIAYIWQD